MTDTTNIALQQVLKNDSKAYLGIFAVSFCMFLLIAVLAQAMTWEWRSWLPGAEAEKSLIGGVKGAVYTFMSHLL
jgi:light-harvesting complex 1 beta chain